MKFREYHTSVRSGSGGISPVGKESDVFVLYATSSNDRLVWTRCNAATVDAKTRTLVNKVQQLCRDLFLPVGYPDSVAEGYLEYQVYDSIQGLSTYLRGVVSTSAVLTAAGVGDAEATAMSAAMTWALRDGLGMIGGLIFSYKASPHFDAHVKEFRLLADVFNDIGLTLDLSLPILLTQMKLPGIAALSNYLPSPYLLLTSLSTLCKVACGICAGATKGNITDHFAITGNRADANAKENTQETLVSLIGMVLGVGLAKWLHYLEMKGDTSIQGDRLVTDAQLISWTIFLILTAIHIWANYVGIQRLQLRTLNASRAKVLLQQLIEKCADWVMHDVTDDDDAARILTVNKCEETIKSPKQIKESLWLSLLGMFGKGDIHLGVRLRDVAKMSTNQSSGYGGDGVEQRSSSTWQKHCIDEFEHENYILLFDEKPFISKPTISVLMKVGATAKDELKAFIHSHILYQCIKKQAGLSHRQLLERSHKITKCLFGKGKDGSDLHNILSNTGWEMSRLYLGFSPWRCDWTSKDD